MAHFDENGYRVSTGQLFASAVSKALNPIGQDQEQEDEQPKPGPRRPAPVPEAGTPAPMRPKGNAELFAQAIQESLSTFR